MYSILPSSDSSTSAAGFGLGKATSAALAALFRVGDVALVRKHPSSGMRFRLRAMTHRQLWLFRGRQQKQAMASLTAMARPADIAFDVGSGIGFWTQALAQEIGGDGQVHAFEPCPVNQMYLAQNIKSFANASLINAAMSNRIGKTPIKTQKANASPTPLQAHTVTLDGYATQHGLTPQVLRIGAGAQALAVLQGGRKTIARARAIMVDVTQDQDMIFGMLETAGFDLLDASGAEITNPAQMAGPVFGTR